MVSCRVVTLLSAYVIFLASVSLVAQEQGSAKVPHIDNGKPDLGGFWVNNSATPFQRPEQFGEKAVFTDEEITRLTQQLSKLRDGDNDQAGHLIGDNLIRKVMDPTFAPEVDAETGDYNAFWLVEREFDNRTSVIVDPPDGRLPPLTTEAMAIVKTRSVHESENPSDSHKDRPLRDRCINYHAPRLNAGYNSYFLVLQTNNHLAIRQEMGNVSRIVPIDGRAHINDAIRQWNGNARGYWDGDTLVIESANYSAATRFRGATDRLQVKERFTLISPGVLEQEVTFHDPSTWTQQWTARLVLKKTDDPIFEWACHEGNYAMEGILRGARLEEKNEHSKQ